jgi:hypothetical protein
MSKLRGIRDLAGPRRAGRLLVWFRCAVVLAILLVLLQTSDLLPPEYFQRRLSEQTTGLVFDFLGWEAQALLVKAGMEFAAPQDALDESQRHQLVQSYFDTMRSADELNREIKGIYSQMEGQAAAQAARAKEQQLADLRAWMQSRQNLVEGILEEQVSAELEAEGFGQWGYVWPPVKVRFTELPLLLVISLRAAITREADVGLQAGLSLTEQEGLEDRVDRRFANMRSLVTPIGGMSAYPAMILENDSLVWLADTFAHEWTHHFLIFFPLGYSYRDSGEMTSINETTASIVGREVGRLVILRYYPELADRLPALPVPPATPPMTSGELTWPDEPPAGEFSFDREMRQTRLHVDALLVEGKVDEAEAYMEEQRQVFVDHGYTLRKLNQAYFAFYGSYATSPSTGNPIGGQLEWLRAQSPTLRAFLLRVARISKQADLVTMLGQAGATESK